MKQGLAVTLVILLGGCTEKGSTAPDARLPLPPAEKAPPPSAAPAASVDAARIQATIARLSGFVQKGASDATNAWALAHGLVGFGPELRASDGRLAIDVLVGDFAVRETVGGKPRIRFPRQTAQGQPVEPHRDLVAKSLVEAGVPEDRKFTLKSGGSTTLAELLTAAEAHAVTPTIESEWHDWGWTLSAILASQRKSPAEREILTLESLAYLESQQDFLTRLMEAGQPERVEKRKQLIYAHTCGGLHLVQAVLLGASQLEGDAHRARVQKQLDTVLFRYRAEREIYRKALQDHPQYAVVLRTQELKFYGHVLETLSLAHKWGIYSGSARAAVEPIVADLIATIDALAGAYGQLEQVRAAREQTYFDLIGDGCHAIRGLRGTLVAFFAG